MTRSLEETKVRLENIHSIEPLLTALRTISLANWRQAINKQESLKVYISELIGIYRYLDQRYQKKNSIGIEAPEVIFVIGSNRGLCANFNRDIARVTTEHMSLPTNSQSKIIIIGDRLRKIFHRQHIRYHEYYDCQYPSSINYSQINELAKQYIFTEASFRVSVIYNNYQGYAPYNTVKKSIFPYSLNRSSKLLEDPKEYILDTYPNEMMSYLERQLSLLSFYSAYLSSAAAEHSTRYQLMESASKNADRLSEELEIEIHFHLRQKITSDMRELAIGAGLLKTQ